MQQDKWTTGEPYERSRRLKHVAILEQNENDYLAYTSSLHHDENTWEILNQSIVKAEFKSSNKREDLDLKIAKRDMVQQISYNPFLTETNYVNDISNRDKFLKPKNTKE